MSSTSSHASATVGSPLGAVRIEVSASTEIAIDVRPVTPLLPAGMAVDGVVLATIRVGGAVTSDQPLRIRVDAGREGGPNSGECLESMEFPHPEGVIQAAVRDEDWLAGRGIGAELVSYEAQGFVQAITGAAAGAEFYVSVAWRRDPQGLDPDDVSTWFAVDAALPWSRGGRTGSPPA